VDANNTSTASTFRMDTNKHPSVSTIVDAVGRFILIFFYSFIFFLRALASTIVDTNNTSTASTFRVDANNHPSVPTFVDAIGHPILIVFYSFIFFVRALVSTIVDANHTSTASTFRVDANKHPLVSTFVDAVGRLILIVFYSFIFS
jgi:hypothetical protein